MIPYPTTRTPASSRTGVANRFRAGQPLHRFGYAIEPSAADTYAGARRPRHTARVWANYGMFQSTRFTVMEPVPHTMTRRQLAALLLSLRYRARCGARTLAGMH